MTKPKNRIFCPAIGRSKMLFESEEKANRFIEFNEPDIKENGTKEIEHLRPYYCEVCGGWHITHALLSTEEAKKRDIRVRNIIEKSTAAEERKKVKLNNEQLLLDAYSFVMSFDFSSFESKKKFRKFLNNPDLIPPHLELPQVLHIAKELPPEYFGTTKQKEEEKQNEEEIKTKASELYSLLPLSKLTSRSMIEQYIKWEFIYKLNTPIVVIKELYKLCGLV